ncbi:putative small lipoprotein YifL [Pseudoxanthomonas japonensis]|uniref:LPS translocon maturation chaperone LptM n=1 Tax=Pseudoxanthomonas japonensis TaxID=69284 RepID=UPI002864413B|nr:lipoprotein [Pseudoxanthomonas japonensis]MDR7068255.1 putative small lipoprotein YifL [Pseudoxanthomonas japonensis]
MNRNARLVLAAALMAVLSACGAKGPLFMPEKPVEEAPVAPAESTPASSDTLPAEPPIDPATVPATDGNG